jgi:hypothetical protein
LRERGRGGESCRSENGEADSLAARKAGEGHGHSLQGKYFKAVLGAGSGRPNEYRVSAMF